MKDVFTMTYLNSLVPGPVCRT